MAVINGQLRIPDAAQWTAAIKFRIHAVVVIRLDSIATATMGILFTSTAVRVGLAFLLPWAMNSELFQGLLDLAPSAGLHQWNTLCGPREAQ